MENVLFRFVYHTSTIIILRSVRYDHSADGRANSPEAQAFCWYYGGSKNWNDNLQHDCKIETLIISWKESVVGGGVLREIRWIAYQICGHVKCNTNNK